MFIAREVQTTDLKLERPEASNLFSMASPTTQVQSKTSLKQGLLGAPGLATNGARGRYERGITDSTVAISVRFPRNDAAATVTRSGRGDGMVGTGTGRRDRRAEANDVFSNECSRNFEIRFTLL